eukprot:m51a1_g303 hypothetical protein (226) ;mRNA; r:381813-382552
MKVLALNGSPRRGCNTAQLLQRALEGAASAVAAGEAQTEVVQLRGVAFRGCASCFECRRLGGASYGACAMRDGLTDVLRKVDDADVLLVGSPVYLGSVSADFKAMMERVVFRYLAYDSAKWSLAPAEKPVGVVLTMGVPRERYEDFGYEHMVQSVVEPFQRVYGPAVQTVMALDTYQFSDYSRYHGPVFNPEHKAAVREEQFPKDLQAAFDMGARLAQVALTQHH